MLLSVVMRCYRALSDLRSPKNSSKIELSPPFVIHINITIYIINKVFYLYVYVDICC